MLRNTWWRCHKAPLSSSFGCVCEFCSPLWSYLYSAFWGTAFVSFVFLLHLAQLAVTGHPFLGQIHPWSHGMVVKVIWCVMEGCSKPSQCPGILDSQENFWHCFLILLSRVLQLRPCVMKNEFTSCLVLRTDNTQDMWKEEQDLNISYINCSGWDMQTTVSSMLWAVVTFQVMKYFFKMSL